MIHLPILRRFILFFIACVTLVGSCTRTPDIGVTSLKPATLIELQGDLLGQKADLGLFRFRGPFAVTMQKDYEIRLSITERINTDLFLSAHGEKAPLVIILHGFDRSKEDHTYQAMHLASWGMHSLSLQLPNRGPWVSNGKTLVAVALAGGAPATGAILLDPAAISRELPGYLSRIKKPVLIRGANEHVSPARNRDYFSRNVRSGIGEVSIKDAIHEDAQFPSGSTQAIEELQVTFMRTLTSAALSISSTGKFDYAWASFGYVLKNGKFFSAKKK